MRCYDGEAANASEQVYDLCHFFFGIICKNKHFSRNLSNDSDKKRRPSHFSQQRLSPNLHPAKSEPFLPQVLQRGADMIYCVVNAE
jgi:hypothetical protein